MNLETKIKMATAFKGISQSQLARTIGTTPQNFNQKLKRQTFTQEELHRIAEALGATYHCYFEFPDGTKI